MDPLIEGVSGPAKANLPARVPRPELIRLIESFCSSTDLRTHYKRLIRLIRWLQHSGITQRGFGQVLAFSDYLEANHELRQRFQANFGELLRHQHSISLFAEGGIPSDGSLPSEIVRRVVGRVLPSARSDADAAKLLTALYASDREARHFVRMPVLSNSSKRKGGAARFADDRRPKADDRLRYTSARSLVAACVRSKKNS